MNDQVLILDGGMSRELERLGAPFRQPEWSALALIEAPEFVTAAHREFAAAGANMITVDAYALVPFHIGEQRFASDGHRLAVQAGQIARAVGDDYEIIVAGDLPPALGSYRPESFAPERATEILKVLVEAQAPYVDVWLSETLSSVAEAETVRSVLAERRDRRPWWVSFTLADELDHEEQASLRSGESVESAVERALELGADMVSFNCSPPEVMEPAVTAARHISSTVPIGVYANAFELCDDGAHQHGDTGGHGGADSGANEKIHRLRTDLAVEAYTELASRWVAAGATAIGGCCGIGSAHIAALAARFRPLNPIARPPDRQNTPVEVGDRTTTDDGEKPKD